MAGFNNTPSPSEFHRHSVGLGHVGSYQVSVRPYLLSNITAPVLSSGTPTEIQFPNVTRFVVITNTLQGSSANVPLRVGFSAAGVRGDVEDNYLILNNGESFEADFKITSVFILSDSESTVTVSIAAGLTGIPRSHLPNNWSGMEGVG